MNIEYAIESINELIGKHCENSIKDLQSGAYLIDREDFYPLISQLKNEISDLMLIYICAVDYPEMSKRFQVIYHFLNLASNERVMLKVELEEGCIMQSISDIYPNSGWYEREIWDMYGMLFAGNNDMRRLLTDYGFVGHPMRKDFPLTGYIEIGYNELKGSVEYSTVVLQQDFRNFDAVSGWNILHGDEKANRE